MNEFELAGLVASLSADAGRLVLIFVTVLFAYLVLAQFVEAALERAYVTILTTMHTTARVRPILGAYHVGTMVFAITQANAEISQSLEVTATLKPGIVFIVLLGIFWLLSLAFLYRMGKKAGANSQ